MLAKLIDHPNCIRILRKQMIAYHRYPIVWKKILFIILQHDQIIIVDQSVRGICINHITFFIGQSYIACRSIHCNIILKVHVRIFAFDAWQRLFTIIECQGWCDGKTIGYLFQITDCL